MSLSMQTSNRVFRTVKTISRHSPRALSRRAHTIAFSPPLKSHDPFPSLLKSSTRPTPTVLTTSVSRDCNVHKRRRYSSQAHAATPGADTLWDAQAPTRGEGVQQHNETRPVRRYDRRSDRLGQYEDGGMVVISSKGHFRDRHGRPWSKSSEEGIANRTEDAGVGIGPVSKPRRKPRLQLRDLNVKPKKKLEPWQAQKATLSRKFGDDGWNPRKKLSPDAMDGIRALHEEDPERWSTPLLAEHFRVSPEAIRRILKSKWRPRDEEEMQKRRERWAKRYDRIWDHQAELGLRPQRVKDREVEDPDAFDEELRAREILDNARKA
ncbi:uncharacterized protein Z520_03970 [Fonsecaea multimorphosa CBS 102226]|uniref:Required for respiratory growth protein 9, mitochondrial n=1 Tax=Fonsecaea multimorphosa CBS 102226 TaxID=1442371 RepID=A0A0D2KAW1_9EURO|nr:uncharacterized protein Z520_03970 [Fonsecaea multimorphosa CBS 102226]KIY00285.1 hypothetical protein Z520_03970 [Fonsecaea multimorphosa CBS 102226]OAL27118.1 hypothetical protein AYO22_03749 [Fonsecaea multimorphosa]